MTDFYNMLPMHYWSHPAGMSKETFIERLHLLAANGQYIASEKMDGNWSRGIVNPSGKSVLQSRGISKSTGTFCELQEKVTWWEDVKDAFSGLTVLLGEIYMPGGIDRDVGSILRSLTPRALALQKNKKLEWRLFDVLAYEGIDLMNAPLEERIKYLPMAVKAINNPLVTAIAYREMNNTFFDWVNDIFARGGEGAVCCLKNALYEPDKRTAWRSIKVKQEIGADVDAFITRTEPAIKEYTGKDIATWEYWEDIKTGEKINEPLYTDYRLGKRLIRPITKGHFYGWPGAVYCGVFDNSGNVIEICKVAGLTEEMKKGLCDNWEDWDGKCLALGGMMFSTANKIPSIRHPYIKSIREDINKTDCTLSKIIGG